MDPRAKDIMTTSVVIGHPAMTIEEAIKVLFNNRITGLPIVDDKKRVVGVISEYDVIRAVEHAVEARPVDLNETIKFSGEVTTIHEEADLQDILALFLEKKIRRLPVLNKSKQLVGIITRRDIMRVLFYRSKTF